MPDHDTLESRFFFFIFLSNELNLLLFLEMIGLQT